MSSMNLEFVRSFKIFFLKFLTLLIITNIIMIGLSQSSLADKKTIHNEEQKYLTVEFVHPFYNTITSISLLGISQEQFEQLTVQEALELINSALSLRKAALISLPLPYLNIFEETQSEYEKRLKQPQSLTSTLGVPPQNSNTKSENKKQNRAVDPSKQLAIVEGISYDSVFENLDKKTFLSEIIQRTAQIAIRNKDNKMLTSLIQLKTASAQFISDDVLIDYKKQKMTQYYARDPEVEKIIDTLARSRKNNPLLIGSAFTGRTSVIEKFIQKLIKNSYPDLPIFNKKLDKAFVVKTGLFQLAGLGDNGDIISGITKYFNSILKINNTLGINIIVFIDNIELFPSTAAEALKPFLKGTNGVQVIARTNSKQFNINFKNNDEFKNLFGQITIKAFTVNETIELLQNDYIKIVETEFNVQFSEEAIETLVKNTTRIMPETSILDAATVLLQDLALSELRKQGQNAQITENEVYIFIQEKLGYPVNPLDGPGFHKYLNNIQNKLTDKVVGQDRMIKDTLHLWAELLEDQRRTIRSGILIGPSGVGKSELTREMAKIIFDNHEAILTIQGNTITEKEQLSSYFGAPNGYVSSGETSGEFMDWMDDPSRGKFGGIIIIEEGEKAHPMFWQRIMEFLDHGKIPGNDGKYRFANRHLVLITSNRGKKLLLPQNADSWPENKLLSHFNSFSEVDLKDLFTKKEGRFDQKELPEEILNRIDMFSLANPITPTLMLRIGHMTAEGWVNEFIEESKLNIDVSDELIKHLALFEYRMQDGARKGAKQVLKYLNRAKRKLLSHTPLSSGDLIYFSLQRKGKKANILVTVNKDKKNVINIPAPNFDIDDPIDDSELRKVLDSLEENVNQRVFGQEEVLESIVDTIYAHQIRTKENKTRPASIFLVGSTGIGKSEMAKALAENLFGNESSALVVGMGDIHSTYGMNEKVWGTPQGNPTEFEQFVKSNWRTGGIILWDEISNMGGIDQSMKNTLFKMMYDVIEEGRWTPPNSSDPINMSNFVFIFTGNDGEQLFSGVTADDLRLSIWQDENKRESLVTLLKNLGVPEAFLGRMADVILAKPLTLENMKKIVSKFTAPMIKAYEKRNVEILIDDKSLKQIAISFFSQQRGARSIRGFIEDRLEPMIGRAYSKVIASSKDKEIKVKIDVTDNLPSVAYVDDDWERKVEVNLSISDAGQVIYKKNKNFTDMVTHKYRRSKEGTLSTAFHEAGHAATLQTEITHLKLKYLTILGEGNHFGYSRHAGANGHNAQHKNPTRQFFLARIANLLAGQRAAQLAGFEPDSGWGGSKSSDIWKARQLATDYFIQFGDPKNSEFLSLPLNEQGSPILGALSEKLQALVQDLLNEADQLAIKLLLEKWSLVVALKNRLIIEGSFSDEIFLEIEESVKNDQVKWVLSNDGRAIKSTSSENSWHNKAWYKLKSLMAPQQKTLPQMTDVEFNQLIQEAQQSLKQLDSTQCNEVLK